MRISDWSSDVCSSDLLGLNYPNWPKPEDTDASVFFKTRTAVVGPDETIRFPKLITVQPQAYFAYEIELVAMSGSNGLADRHNGIRSEERRVGKEWVSTSRSWGSTEHNKQKSKQRHEQ